MSRVERGKKEFLFILLKPVVYQFFLFVSLVNTAVVATVSFKEEQESLNRLISAFFQLMCLADRASKSA